MVCRLRILIHAALLFKIQKRRYTLNVNNGYLYVYIITDNFNFLLSCAFSKNFSIMALP